MTEVYFNNCIMAKISNDEKRWRAEADADAMARYEEIMGDASRRAAAVKVAKTRAAELTKRASAMSRVVNSGSRTVKKTKI